MGGDRLARVYINGGRGGEGNWLDTNNVPYGAKAEREQQLIPPGATRVIKKFTFNPLTGVKDVKLSSLYEVWNLPIEENDGYRCPNFRSLKW